MELHITIADIVIVVVLLWTAAHAAMKGFLRQVLSIFAFIAAAVATLKFYPVFRPVAQANVEPAWLADGVAFVGLFLIVLIPLSFISYRLSETVKKSPVGPLDRSLGFFFGVAYGLFFLSVAYIVLTMLVAERNQPEWIQEARLLPLVQSSSNILLSLVPEDSGLPRSKPVNRNANTDGDEAPAPKPPVARANDNGPTYTDEERNSLDSLVGSSTRTN